MNQINNIKLLLNSNKVKKMSKIKLKLSAFGNTSGLNKYLLSIITNIKKVNNTYIFSYHNKEYYFTQVSDLDISNLEKELVKSDKKYKGNEYFFRSLKLACSLDLINPRIVIATSESNILDTLILFEENGKEKIICYEKNMIMDKNDYYELFDVKEISIVTKPELYIMSRFIEDQDNLISLIYMLLFPKEVLKEIEPFLDPYYKYNYDNLGINKNNYSFMGEGSDSLFFEAKDYIDSLKKIREKINDFTLLPRKKSIRIKEIEPGKYQYKDKNYTFNFRLLSDTMDDGKLKRELLSEERFHKCHLNSGVIAIQLHDNNNLNPDVVSGKGKLNEKDYYYHSWIELNNKVIDPTMNIIMPKEEYYKLIGAVVINRTPANIYKDNLYFVFNNNIFRSITLFNYFNQEIVKDIERHKIKTKND